MMANTLTELVVGHIYRFGSDHVVEPLNLKGAGLGKLLGPNGNFSEIPLLPVLDTIGEDLTSSD